LLKRLKIISKEMGKLINVPVIEDADKNNKKLESLNKILR